VDALTLFVHFSNVQWSTALSVRRVDFRATRDEKLKALKLPRYTREMCGSAAVPASQVQICALLVT
jgi:hypothetical protein